MMQIILKNFLILAQELFKYYPKCLILYSLINFLKEVRIYMFFYLLPMNN